jgi:hypothetical protein
MISQQTTKKRAEKPSGPGHLSRGMPHAFDGLPHFIQRELPIDLPQINRGDPHRSVEDIDAEYLFQS